MKDLILTILTSVAAGSIGGILVNALIEAWKSKQMTKLDALKTAILLEGYTISCASKIADHNTAKSSGGHAGSYLAKVPELPELHVSVGFLRPQRASVANRIMIFSQEHFQAEQTVSFWWDVVGDVDCYRNSAAEQASRMALRSMELAQDIRVAFKLPSRDLIFGDCNIRDVLEDAINEQH